MKFADLFFAGVPCALQPNKFGIKSLYAVFDGDTD